MGKQLIPIYDIMENQAIDKTKFTNTFGFVDTTISQRRKATVAFAALATTFLIFGVVGAILIVVKKRQQ